ncbi:Alcohol dehydrogenase zinc-binding domain protein [Kribbella flavida DSM 17836]|uniref:Alcohol dehydrogenase zinc-binding domain protein n=1 Tax=Kribbella flavida (strain DSM 17836 / JCM 10339 / NBRC 14399) TaxID=479435 RepID=D2PTZ0_KRIFD|nr:NAD(P)-dependent alcohol dehydrogenase [Kribbella flavida]ADB33273.1 Alcohol dehydrogenase zinc-binding domain protein [Kribbella flavida DSM 17836]
MKAIVQDRYGPPEVLRLDETDQPVAGSNQVLVRVRAAGVDQGTWHLMAGQPRVVRLAVGLRRPRVRISGRDVAGVVEAVGAGVTELKVGDEVYGTCESGSFAEYAVGRADRLTRKPANLTFEQAAAVPISAGTALQGLRDVRPGDHVLVLGAAGGVGSYAVQLAKAACAHVTGVCSTAKLDLVRELGADEALDYTRDELPAAAYDLILDAGGNRSLRTLRRSLTPKGTLVLVGAETGGALGGLDRALRATLLSPFIGQRLRGLISTERADDYAHLRTLIEFGKVTPAIDRTYPLAEAPAAIHHLRERHPRGKLVITV